MNKIEVKYYWKQISNDGLVKDPPKRGPYYNEIGLNDYGYGYSSEQEAIDDLMSKSSLEYHWGALILVKEYRVVTK